MVLDNSIIREGCRGGAAQFIYSLDGIELSVAIKINGLLSTYSTNGLLIHIRINGVKCSNI